MNLSDLAQPTTVIGLAGLAIFAIVYLSIQHNKNMKISQDIFIKSLNEKDKNYQSFVLERNHQTGEVIQKNTEVLVMVGENIKNNTESIKQLVELHLKK